MIFIFLAGIALWLAYGILTAKLPIIISNGVTFVLVLGLLICKYCYRVAV
jgi:MtN3 and saliva related transmembrane protein